MDITSSFVLHIYLVFRPPAYSKFQNAVNIKERRKTATRNLRFAGVTAIMSVKTSSIMQVIEI